MRRRRSGILTLGCGILFMATATRAQDISVGLIGGLTYTSPQALQNGSAREIYERRSGYHFGLFVDLGLSERTHLRPAAIWSVKEIGVQPGGGGLSLGSDFQLNHVDVPLDLRLELAIPFIAPYVLLGPQAAIRIDARDEDDRSLKDRFRLLSWSANVGLGLRMHVLGLVLYPELRYNFGLDKLNERGPWEDLKLNMVQLRLGLAL
jgi:hypothetical protein|nr:MAG: hypothetical protein KatS3mg041_0780 [Bacteroidota bacterium]